MSSLISPSLLPLGPPPLASGLKAKRAPIPPLPDPSAGADGCAMGDRKSPSLLNPAGYVNSINKIPFVLVRFFLGYDKSSYQNRWRIITYPLFVL